MNFRYKHRLFSAFDLFFRKKEVKNLELILDGIGDVIPGEKWIENCLNISSTSNYIINCAGRRIPKNTYFLGTRNELHKYYFCDITPGYNYHFCKENILVDFGSMAGSSRRSRLEHFGKFHH